ncbi:hypothetical protein [Campylobacter sp.]|uniref:hypothetical protein n=1 Tax=Campylobacter sp. TaxID=205 RepID=UPI0025C6BDAB|nr:hypothetical protein [Campylobacter sp.]
MKNDILKQDTYFKDEKNNVFFFEKGTDRLYIAKNLMEISDEKAKELLMPSLSKYKATSKSKASLFYQKNKDFINFEDHIYDFNEKSVKVFLELLKLERKEYDIITRDNEIVKLTHSKLTKLTKMMIEVGYNNALELRKLKDDIDNAESIERIDFILNDKGIL